MNHSGVGDQSVSYPSIQPLQPGESSSEALKEFLFSPNKDQNEDLCQGIRDNEGLGRIGFDQSNVPLVSQSALSDDDTIKNYLEIECFLSSRQGSI